MTSASPLAVQLGLFAPLWNADAASAETHADRIRYLPAREVIVQEGAASAHAYVIMSGWACRSRRLANGRRQIVGLLLPGDVSDWGPCISRADHSLSTITAVQLAEIPQDVMREIASSAPQLGRALWVSLHRLQAIERQLIVSLGQRTARERLGHMLCELFKRLQRIGFTRGNEFDLPLTQSELSEAAGLSQVHINRTLKDLRKLGLIVLNGKTIVIPDLARLQKVSLFDHTYLQLGDDL